MTDKLIAFKESDESPGPPYQPVIRVTHLYQTTEGRFYICYEGQQNCKTWVDSQWAKRFIEKCTPGG